ncbi:hypothetical protein NHX12_009468 [Muraenolepis orangiensis]|uniref:Protein kinase domain-containing protein n=1 Tax=Muraenolepis orangiensis TaxID=630683 RepID=A0A9Q0DHQ1_9TELE|nr:hypothetical protein NHX12_009468 [Muraenolepis orangiensis]
MGGDASRPRKRPGEDQQSSSGWRGVLSGAGLSLPAGLCHLAPSALRLNHRRLLQAKAPDIPDHVLRLAGVGPHRLRSEWSLPAFVSMFLPEFPHRSVPGHQDIQVLGYIAKGSFGPILKVKDKVKQKTYAVKVIPKSEILRHGVLEQSKEEVIVQRQVHHPFVHDLQDCWQTQRHLYIMCDYCSTGDLYTYWVMIGRFSEDTVRLFAAELGSALAPEVLSGGPYNHAADWWSLGILLFSLVTGKFPVAPEADHCRMLRKVRCFPYEMPLDLTPPLVILLTEVILELRERPDRSAKARRGLTLSLQPLKGFDYDSLLSPPESPDAHLDDLTQARPHAHLDDLTQARPDAHLDDLTQARPHAHLDDLTQARPDAHLDDLTQARPHAHLDYLTQRRPDAHLDDLTQPRPNAHLDDLTQPRPDAPLDDLTQARPDAHLDDLTQPRPDAHLDDLTQARPDAHLDDLTQARPDAHLDDLTQARPDAHLDDLTQARPASVLPGPATLHLHQSSVSRCEVFV